MLGGKEAEQVLDWLEEQRATEDRSGEEPGELG